ncbi:MAG: hypothetical protein JXR96_05765 [Deltaproteobacteria bacterium]|nr:hypothetical protein [Deltaproteobacteria bacterium]
MRVRFVVLLGGVLLAGCGSSPEPVCVDDGHADGPPCVERIGSPAEFEAVSIEAGYLTGSDRITKYMAPAREDETLLPALFQNGRRTMEHLTFLITFFPERFSGLDPQAYMDLVLRRDTRDYYSGAVVHIDDPILGSIYGFTVYTLSSSAELLEPDEVLALHGCLDAVFDAGELYYTFDPFDAMARQKAAEWVEPGFPIYFY